MAKYQVICVILDAPDHYSMTALHEVEADKDIEALKSVVLNDVRTLYESANHRESIKATTIEEWQKLAKSSERVLKDWEETAAHVLERLANPQRSTSTSGITTLSVYVEHEYNPVCYIVKADIQ